MKKLSVHAERFFVRLIMKADDYGCFHAAPSLLKANLFPYLLDSIREADVLRWMAECQKAGLIVLYGSDGKKFVHIVDFRQRLDKARSKYPLPKATDFPELVNGFPSEVETEVEPELKNTGAPPAPPAREKKVKKEFVKPTVEELKQYFILKIGNAKNPGHWPEDKCSNQADLMFDHYKMNGWIQAKGKPVIDWQAACRNWIRRALQGVFDKPTPVAREKEPARRRRTEDPGPQLGKVQEELNYLYARWLENTETVTVISIQSDHYNHLKKAGMISFSEEQLQKIQHITQQYMTEKGLSGEQVMVQAMKKHGVLEYFTHLKSQGKETVFHDPK